MTQQLPKIPALLDGLPFRKLHINDGVLCALYQRPLGTGGIRRLDLLRGPQETLEALLAANPHDELAGRLFFNMRQCWLLAASNPPESVEAAMVLQSLTGFSNYDCRRMQAATWRNAMRAARDDMHTAEVTWQEALDIALGFQLDEAPCSAPAAAAALEAFISRAVVAKAEQVLSDVEPMDELIDDVVTLYGLTRGEAATHVDAAWTALTTRISGSKL